MQESEIEKGKSVQEVKKKKSQRRMDNWKERLLVEITDSSDDKNFTSNLRSN